MKTPQTPHSPRPFSIASVATAALCFPGGASAAAQPEFAEARVVATVAVPNLVEASGIVASRSQRGTFWSHNDKGGSAEIFGFAADGSALGKYVLSGATSIDYEDIAIGRDPDDGLWYLYVGDIGDGNKSPIRENIQVYRLQEPKIAIGQGASPIEVTVEDVVVYNLRYPDGPRNAETLMVDPVTGDLIIISQAKEPELVGIYRVPKEELDKATATDITMLREGDLGFDVANAGDISPAGDEIIIRQEGFARLWQRAQGQSIAEALATPPFDIPIVGKPLEKNGEAICFDPDGSGYFTLSDSSETQPLYYFERVSEHPLSEPQVTRIQRTQEGWLELTVSSGGPARTLTLEYSEDAEAWQAIETIDAPQTGDASFLFRPTANARHALLRVRRD